MGLGLAIVWPIALIWTIVAVSSHNDSNNKSYSGQSVSSQPTVNTSSGDDSTYYQSENMSTERRACYDQANQKTDAEIDTILAGSTAILAPMYIEELKDVQAKRKEKKDFFDDAMGKTAEEVDLLLSNSATLSPLYIRALRYINRCSELKSKPTYEGFLQTFERSYLEPETPAEAEARINRDQEAIKQRNRTMAIGIPIIALIILFLVFGLPIIQKHNDYKDTIWLANSYSHNYLGDLEEDYDEENFKRSI